MDDPIRAVRVQGEEAPFTVVDADTLGDGDGLARGVDRQMLVRVRHRALTRDALNAIDRGGGVGLIRVVDLIT